MTLSVVGHPRSSVNRVSFVAEFLPARRCICRYTASQRILPVIRVKRVHGIYDLGEIVFCLRLSRLVLDCFESRKEQANQNRNDRDDDEQLDESERATSFGELVRFSKKGGCPAQVPCGSGVHRGDSMRDK